MAFIPWLDATLQEALKPKAVPRDEYRQVLSRLDLLERDVVLIKEGQAQMRAEFREDQARMRAEFRGELGELRGELGELRGELGELRREMNERFDGMYERMLVQTRWTVGTIALFATILTILMAIAQFSP